MVRNTHIKVMYTWAVWREGTQEEEGVVSDIWINREKKTVRWPHKRRECDTYNLTSQAEEDDNEVIKLTRKRTKKGIPEDFVRSGLTDSNEESVMAVKLPTFPTAPRKLQPIEDTNMLLNTSHEDGVESGQVESADSPWEMSTPRSRHAARGHARDGYRSSQVQT
ncbi:uncharacterized protein LOC121724676 isoform X3 [Alosa sapidissima]|uniref:uncharacterized protein LOC121724676 isoform X3 n=1 Tax=Alosa sapidissima TaxID=34773 RepID=UPI001C09CA1F|nr:uncharacterized protein LOC121724676 isoform X3 [Alosa sapidissima]